MLKDSLGTRNINIGRLRLSKRRRIATIVFFTAVCSVCIFVGFESRLEKVYSVSHGQRALKTTGIEDDDPYGALPRNIENIFASFREQASNDVMKELMLRYLRDHHKKEKESLDASPTLYLITPTYKRVEQVAELTRLGQTLRQVKNIHWLVIEDSEILTPAVQRTVRKMGIPFTLLTAPMPAKYKKARTKPRGVSNRNAALEWLRKNDVRNGVLYFADDDNSYDLELFEEIRKTEKVSMWPVGMVTNYGLSTPIVKNGTVIGFYDGWVAKRKFPVDMAGFAVNVGYLRKFPNVKMPFTPGYEEDGFLVGLNISKSDIEPLADNCTKILVWHTQTKKASPANKAKAVKHSETNIPLLVAQII